MMHKELLTQKEIANIGEEIGAELGHQFITEFNEKYPNETAWFSMGKNILQSILEQPGCAGIRFYNGINEKGQKTLVYVGMDSEGKDLIKHVVVEKDGSIAARPAIVADRNDNGDSIWTTILTWFK